MSSSIETYGGEGGRVASDVARHGADSLAMTGLPVEAIVIVALLFVGAGLLLWIAERDSNRFR